MGAAAARADTAPIQVPAGSQPWSDPAHRSPLETLAGAIASHIAGRAATIRCEDQATWQSLASAYAFDSDRTLGYVAASWPTLLGVPQGVPTISSYAEISPTVCGALQTFALAAVKPTKCSQPVTTTVTGTTAVTVQKKVRIRKKIVSHGRLVWQWTTRTVTVTKDVPTQTSTQAPGPPAPCVVNGVELRSAGGPGFWASYDDYVQAVLTLTHEAIHLGGVVGGALATGAQVGDPLAEAHAECYGMQWLPYAAEQLGDTPDDAQALAQYAYAQIYPRYKGTAYWSADCVPGGAMDVRADKTGAWP